MQQNQNTDPLVDHLYKNYYKDKLTKEQISKKLYSNPESYEGGLRALYKDVYKGKVESYDQMKGLYQQKYGDPFAKKKVQSEQPTTPPSEPSQESLDQPMGQEPQMDLPVNPFQDAAPLSLQEQQIGATLGQGGILSGQPLTPEGSVTASKIQQARVERPTNDVGQVTEQASVGGDYEQTLEKVQEKTFGERLATAGRVGLGKIVTMAAKIPGYVDEINLGGKLLEGLFKYGIDKKLQNKFEKGELTKEELEKERQRRYKSNPYITNPIKDAAIDALEENSVVKSIENFEKQWGEYKEENDKTITRHLAEGNFKEAGLQTMVSVVESLPVTLAAMFGGPVGLAGITMGTAAEKEDQLAEQNPEMSDAARITNATLTGLFEGGTELVTAGIGAKTIKAFVAEQGEEAVKEAVAKTFKDQVGNTLKKISGKTYVEEGLSEGANAFGEAVVDWATGASDTLDLSAVGDAIIVGGASGKLVGGVAQDVAKVSKNIKNRQADNRAVQIAEKSKETATERLKRREKIDGGVKDRAMEVVEFAKANGVKDIDEAFDQYQQQLPENVREEVLKDGVDIVKIAKTNAAIDEELQDTEETQQDEATAGQAEAESQTQEEVQEQQVEEEVDEQTPQEVEQPTEEEVTAEPVEEEQVVDDASQQENQVEPELDDTEPNVEEPELNNRNFIKLGDFVKFPKSEIKEGGEVVLYRGNIRKYDGDTGSKKNLPKFGIDQALGVDSFERDRQLLEADIKELKDEIKEYEIKLADESNSTDKQSIWSQKRVAEDVLKNAEKDYNKLIENKGKTDQLNKEAEELNLLYLTTQPITATSYATADFGMNPQLMGSEPIPNVDEVSVIPKKIFDTTRLGDDKGELNDEGKEEVAKLLGVNVDEFYKGKYRNIDRVFQLFRGDLAKQMVEKLKNNGFDSVIYNEGSQENFIVLDRSIVSDVKNADLLVEEENVSDAYEPFQVEHIRSYDSYRKLKERANQEVDSYSYGGFRGRPIEIEQQEVVNEQPVVEEAEPTVAQEQATQKVADVSEATSPSNTQELINEIKEKGDPVQKELASMVETLGAVDNIETTNENLGQLDSRKGLGKAETSGRYGSKIAKVALDDQAIEEFADEHGLDAVELRQHAATHEMTHAITMQAIHASRKIRDQRKKGMSFKEIAKDMSKQTGANITEGDVKAIATLEDDIDALRVKVSNELAKGNISLPTEDDRMGLRGTMDFIAETFSNPKFRNELAKVKVLDKVIDAIKKFINKFGGDKILKAAGAKKGTALESAIEQGFRAMDFYAKLNQHKIDAVNNIRQSDQLTDTEKDNAIESYMALSNQDPDNVQKTRKYIEAKLDKLADADIVADAADAFDIDVDDAIRLLEEIAGRDFRPDINTIQAVGETQVGVVGFFFRIREKMTGKTIDPEVLATYMKPFDRIRIEGQDKYLGLKRYQQAIEKVYGKNIPDEMNAYILREQANSVSADFQIQLFVDMFGQERGKIGFDKALKGSLVYQMNKQDGITWDQVNDYSYYRHAIQFNDRVTDRRAKRYQKAQDKLLELNQELAQLDPDATPDAYKNIEEQIKQVNRLAEQNKPLDNPPSGVDSDVAARKVAEMEAQHPNIKAWADTFRDKLMGEYIYILEKNNLVSHERIEHLRNGTASDSDVVFDYYVPLKVKDTAFDNEFEQESPGLGTIFDFGLYKLQGSETNYGKSERHRPLDVALTLVVKAKRTAEINNAIRGYADLLKTYGSQEVSVVDGQVVSKVNAIGDVVQGSVIDYSGKVANAKNKVTYINEKGKMSHLIFKEEKHPVYVGLTTRPQKMKGWIEKAAKGIQKFNNIKRNLITQFRPSFALTNAMRDLQDATFNTIVDNKGQRTKATRKFISNLAKAHKYFNLDRLMPGETGDLPVVGNIGKTGSKVKIGDEKISFAEAWIEMQAAGGAMSWGKYLHNFEEEIADIQKRVDVIEKGISATGKAYDKARQALQLLSEFNEGMENATRLAAYVTAKQLGASTQSAAAVSRDITLNFQRKGTSTGNISLFYLFLNAGIQGVERGMRAMKNGGLLKSAAIVTGIGYMGRVMLHELYKGADDGDREKFEGMIMNPYIRAQKSILPFPWTKEPIMIPKPYSMLRVFLSLGEGLADNQYGYNTMIDVYGDFNMNLLTAVDPIGGFSGSATNLVPGALIRTKVEVWADKQWSGSNILYMKAGENIPSYKKYSKNTDESYVAAAQILYDNFDWNFFAPAYLEYFIEKDINMGLIKDFTGAMDEFVKATGDKRLSEIFRENLMRRAGLRIKKGSSEYVKDTGSGTKEFTVDSPPLKKSRLIPFIKPLYNPKDEDKVVMGNFFTILHKTNNLGKTPLGGLSEGEMEYLKKGYKLLMQEDLIRPSLMSRNMNNLIEKFPNEDWSWYKSYKARYK